MPRRQKGTLEKNIKLMISSDVNVFAEKAKARLNFYQSYHAIV
jgi:hypothetical protein